MLSRSLFAVLVLRLRGQSDGLWGRTMPLMSFSGDDEGYAGNPALQRMLFNAALRARAAPPSLPSVGHPSGNASVPSADGRLAMSPSQFSDYTALVRDPHTHPAALESWSNAQGYPISNAADILSFVRQNPTAALTNYFQRPPSATLQPSPPGLASRLMGSFNEGIADSVGGSVDMVNSGMHMIGLPTSENPIMGSDWIRSIMHSGNMGTFSNAFAPQSNPEYYGQQFARGFGQAAVPFGGKK